MSSLRVLFTEYVDDAYMNLAVEEALFVYRCNNGGSDTLRIWRNKKAVVIGVFQKPDEEVNLDYARNNGIQIVRRFTGGGAVFHDLGNINFAISTKIPPNKPKGIEFLYEDLIYGAVNALKRLGFSPRKENINDIIVEDKKVIGVAGSLRMDCAFLHGAILYDTDLNILSNVLRVPLKKLADKKISSVKYRVTTIKQLKPDITMKDLIKALKESFSEILGSTDVYEDLISKDELELAEKLYKEKYSTVEWNFERKKP